MDSKMKKKIVKVILAILGGLGITAAAIIAAWSISESIRSLTV